MKTSSVVLRPGLYAAWDIDMTFLKRLNVLSTTIIARIFLRTDNKMTGLRFFTGPFGLFGFGNGIRCPILISSGYLPVSATWLRISAIYRWIKSGLYLINSVCTVKSGALRGTEQSGYDCYRSPHAQHEWPPMQYTRIVQQSIKLRPAIGKSSPQRTVFLHKDRLSRYRNFHYKDKTVLYL